MYMYAMVLLIEYIISTGCNQWVLFLRILWTEPFIRKKIRNEYRSSIGPIFAKC